MKMLVATGLSLLLLFVAFIMWWGHETVTSMEQSRYDKDVVLRTVVTSSGGALGNETYRVSYIYRGLERQFFEGTNGRDFALRRAGKSVAITLCDGRISEARPLWLGEPRNERIHLRLDLDCADKQ